METIYNRFPLQEWLHIYTDGSKLEMNDVVGAGVYCEHFSHYLSLGTAKSIFEGEGGGQLTHLNARPPLSDLFWQLLAMILAIANCSQAPSSMSVMQCRSLTGKMNAKYKMIALQWIPSHCGILDPEKVDGLAKKRLFG
ncbi:RNase H domain-containing protein [Nephila pilipes]|uniref:RNase H domain-containing protein n=1 Tax=Nephila pilipes TaxID=299642 RepID=A0A8X6TLV0_NEPPI|nr:RNase H domain-containing protein [Nephila pilipes]